jgi:hypothetical protein
MTKVTNTAEGPRGVLTAKGDTVFVEPGDTVEVDIAKDHDLYPGLETGDAAAKKAAAAKDKEPEAPAE